MPSLPPAGRLPTRTVKGTNHITPASLAERMMKGPRFAWLFLLLAFASIVTHGAVQEEIDGFGNVVRPTSPVQVPVKLINRFDHAVKLYWDAPGDADDMFMMEIPQGSDVSVNTYPGHKSFVTKLDGSDFSSSLASVLVTPQVLAYTIGGTADDADTDAAVRPSALSTPSEGRGVHIRPDSPISIMGYRTDAMSAKFRCLTPFPIDYYYDDGRGGTQQGSLALGKETTTNTYAGHTFFFTRAGMKHEEIARYTMTQDRTLYVIMDTKNPPPKEYLQAWEAEEAFMEKYFNKTGLLWRHYYGPAGPRPPPVLHMWPATQLGDVHKVTSQEGHWSCDGPAATCKSKDPVPMELEVISIAPRAFYIPHFLSDFEAEHIIALAKPQIKASQVGDAEGGGAGFSDTRTSRNAWVGRKASAPCESLYIRAADLLRVDEKLMHSHVNAEDMQVVHYVNGQKYDSHHDWGVSGYPESRLITLLLYLTDMESPSAGGETAFPKGNDGLGFKVEPRKGAAVLFYNLLEDGNGDDLALHAALPVWKGEKWLANFWYVRGDLTRGAGSCCVSRFSAFLIPWPGSVAREQGLVSCTSAALV